VAVIRPAGAGDAEALAELAERTFRETFTVGNEPAQMALHCAASFGPGIQAREIEDPGWVTIVADEDGELIGFAQLRLGSPKACVAAECPAELYRLYVAGRWHGRGVAQQILNEVMVTAARAGSDRIWLGVWERNPRALAFYRKHGFEVVGDHVFRFGTECQTDLIMVAEVDGAPAARGARTGERRTS
jgi:ribosomal protein S18 acetylase RimI-like enzyme